MTDQANAEERINVVIENRLGGRYFTTCTRAKLAEMEQEITDGTTTHKIVASGVSDAEALQMCERALTSEVLEQHVKERPTDALKLAKALARKSMSGGQIC